MLNVFLIFLCSIFIMTGCSSNTRIDSNTDDFNNSNNFIVTERLATNTVIEEKAEEELSSYTSPILITESNRQNNIQLACSELTGTIVKPGEEFSFCATLGPATPEEGYQKAETFDSDGDIVMNYGGGKCQVSSTLYNAVLALNSLEVTERYPHSHKIDYVPEGQDATVAYGCVDFKFINHFDFNIKIYAEATAEDVTIKIFRVY